jgi:hypothetical protein
MADRHGRPSAPRLGRSAEVRRAAADFADPLGSRLLAGLADRTGLTTAFSDALAGLRERRSGHDPGRVLTDLAVLLADGGRSISDLAVLCDQPTLFGPVASTATAWRSWTGPTRPR